MVPAVIQFGMPQKLYKCEVDENPQDRPTDILQVQILPVMEPILNG